MLSIEELRKLSELARISVPDAELEELRGQLETILTYVGEIQTADTTSLSELRSASTAGVAEAKTSLPALRNVWREDDAPHATGEYTEAIVANFPKREGDFLKVKKILEK